MAITQEDIKIAIEKHKKWLAYDDIEGKRFRFNGEDLSGLNFSNANLDNAIMEGCNLSKAIFYESNLAGCDFSNSDLRGAHFQKANLCYSHFEGAFLKDARLSQTKTEGLHGKQVVSIQIGFTKENDALAYWPELNIITMDTFQGTPDELRSLFKEGIKKKKHLKKFYKIVDCLEELATLENKRMLNYYDSSALSHTKPYVRAYTHTNDSES